MWYRPPRNLGAKNEQNETKGQMTNSARSDSRALVAKDKAKFGENELTRKTNFSQIINTTSILKVVNVTTISFILYSDQDTLMKVTSCGKDDLALE